jgi:hypothetical protein
MCDGGKAAQELDDLRSDGSVDRLGSGVIGRDAELWHNAKTAAVGRNAVEKRVGNLTSTDRLTRPTPQPRSSK